MIIELIVSRDGHKEYNPLLDATTFSQFMAETSKHWNLIYNISNEYEENITTAEARDLATRSIDSLIEAEAKVHGETPSDVHLHEAGSIDTVVDIIGTAYALDELGLTKDTKIYSTPVAVGGGLFKFSHGKVQSPAPATLEILRSKAFPMVGGPIEFELTTPTGAALLVNIVDEAVPFYPPIKPMRTGYGSGTKDFESMPNIVRLTLADNYSKNFYLIPSAEADRFHHSSASSAADVC